MDTEDIQIKDAFKSRYSKLTDWESFKDVSLSFLRRSIRVNTLKIGITELKKRISDWELTQVPWCKEGFWIEHKGEEKRRVTNTFKRVVNFITATPVAYLWLLPVQF